MKRKTPRSIGVQIHNIVLCRYICIVNIYVLYLMYVRTYVFDVQADRAS